MLIAVQDVLLVILLFPDHVSIAVTLCCQPRRASSSLIRESLFWKRHTLHTAVCYEKETDALSVDVCICHLIPASSPAGIGAHLRWTHCLRYSVRAESCCLSSLQEFCDRVGWARRGKQEGVLFSGFFGRSAHQCVAVPASAVS